MCGLILLLVLSFVPRGFSPANPLFPFPQKPTFPNSNSIRKAHVSTDTFERVFKIPGWFVGKQMTIYTTILLLRQWMNSYGMTIQMKATEDYFPVVLLFNLCNTYKNIASLGSSWNFDVFAKSWICYFTIINLQNSFIWKKSINHRITRLWCKSPWPFVLYSHYWTQFRSPISTFCTAKYFQS